MDELKFVLRCFGFSALLLILTQLKTGGTTIEHRIEASLMNSRMSEFVNRAADGGVRLIKDGAALARSTYQDWRTQAPVPPDEPGQMTAGTAAVATEHTADHTEVTPKTEQPDSEGTELLTEDIE